MAVTPLSQSGHRDSPIYPVVTVVLVVTEVMGTNSPSGFSSTNKMLNFSLKQHDGVHPFK